MFSFHYILYLFAVFSQKFVNSITVLDRFTFSFFDLNGGLYRIQLENTGNKKIIKDKTLFFQCMPIKKHKIKLHHIEIVF